MKPRLNPGDGVLYYRLDRQFKGDDAVVYKDSEATRIGRIIAQEGDTVDITNDGKLLVNGHQKDEANPYQILPHSSGPSYPYTVPKNSYFILLIIVKNAQIVATSELSPKIVFWELSVPFYE